jgi:sulfopyruvate decarboxylase TPP-binding subunit
LKYLDRYKNDLQHLLEFQTKYPTDKYYYIATGSSIAGSIADLFLESSYLNEAITFNSVIEGRFISNPNIKNYRIYLDEDICYLSMGKYAPNTKVYVMNIVKKQFINPIEEFKYLHKVHSLHFQISSSLSFLIKILKTDKTGDNIVKEDWNNLFNKRLKLIEK